jgi:hypothetical protein
MKRPYILLRLPNFGLANKLILWAKAFIVAKEREIPLYVFHWNRLAIRDFLRRERRTRFYCRFFKSDGVFKWYWIITSFFRAKQTVEPGTIASGRNEARVLILKPEAGIVDFSILKEHRDDIVQAFGSILKASIKHSVSELTPPIIGVHIRRGDFLSNQMALPMSYYKDRIMQIRKLAECSLSTTIFSDGEESQLQEVLSLPDVTLASNRNDLFDLMQLSKSRIIVPTLGSTFSYWAAFLSDGAIIHHPKSWRKNIRPQDTVAYEGDLTNEMEVEKFKDFLVS